MNEFVRQWIEALTSSSSVQKHPLITLAMDLLSLAQGGQHLDWVSNLLSKIPLSDSILLSQHRHLRKSKAALDIIHENVLYILRVDEFGGITR